MNRAEQLENVFAKAVDVTLQAIGPKDTKSCFNDEIREELGASLEGALIQSLGQLKSKLDVSI